MRTVWMIMYAQAAAHAQEGDVVSPTGGLMQMLPLFIAFFAIMYFLLIRPQQKRERERQDMLSSLSKGDSVVTTGGVCGTIVGLSDTHVVLRVDDNVTIEFVRGAVAQITTQDKSGDGDKDKK